MELGTADVSALFTTGKCMAVRGTEITLRARSVLGHILDQLMILRNSLNHITLPIFQAGCKVYI